MRIALISTHAQPLALGLRSISSYLRIAGHDTRMYFMCSRRDTASVDYSPQTLADLVEHVRDCGMIGMSLLTNNFHRAVALTRHLRDNGITAPIVWGGTHPTVAPEECLPHADVVCVGEGEEPLCALADALAERRDPGGIAGLWFSANSALSNGIELRNAPPMLLQDLDALPFPDYDLDQHWIATRRGLAPATPQNLRGALDTLRVITARGCPYQCTFCNNTALRNVHEKCGPWVRTRSLDNVLAELESMVAAFPSIRAFNFVDDLFFIRSADEIADFADKYTRSVNLPLELDAFPNTLTQAKVTAAARLPIQLISMGIESASEKTLTEIYERPTPPKRIAEAIEMLHRAKVRTEYHYLVSNPFEPEENVIETMRFIADHHRGPAVLRVFPLMFYPGSPLHARALASGEIADKDSAAYDHTGGGALDLARHDYLALWLRFVLNLKNVGLPKWLAHRVIDFATARPVRWTLDRRWFGPAALASVFISRKLARNLVVQPLLGPWRSRAKRRQYATPHRPWRVPSVAVARMRQRPQRDITMLERSHAAPRREPQPA